jgi:hypothetical protein
VVSVRQAAFRIQAIFQSAFHAKLEIPMAISLSGDSATLLSAALPADTSNAVAGASFSQELTVAQAGGLLDNLSGPYTDYYDAQSKAYAAARNARDETGQSFVSIIVSREVSTTWGETRTVYYATEAIMDDAGLQGLNSFGIQNYIDATYPGQGFKFEEVNDGRAYGA